MPNNYNLINEINFHDCIIDFINTNHIEVKNYTDMINVYIKMIESNHCFILNHNLKIHMLIDLTYNLNQSQENRQIIEECLDINEVSDSDSESESDPDLSNTHNIIRN
tara:strand:- start:432 stop:755 length:324 start_codon:yes stop_codon:yes gene_type:complete